MTEECETTVEEMCKDTISMECSVVEKAACTTVTEPVRSGFPAILFLIDHPRSAR